MRWKEVEGTDGRYLVSDEGNVFSCFSGRYLKKSIGRGGYYEVELNVNGVSSKRYVHRLVAEAFIPNPNNFPIVNHKDETRLNNKYYNLEWCTHSYNSNYGTCIQRRVKHTNYKYGAEHKSSKTVYQFSLDGVLVGTYGGVHEASRVTGLSSKSISKCANGSLKQYAGYVWNYENQFRPITKKAHFVAGAVLQYTEDGMLVRRYDKPEDVKDYGFNANSVRDVCRGIAKTHRGYIFKYEN